MVTPADENAMFVPLSLHIALEGDNHGQTP
jgi:hypothetical protein